MIVRKIPMRALSLLFGLSMFLSCAHAITPQNIEVIWFEDGSHAEIVTLQSSTRSVTGSSKTYTYWDSGNKKVFSYTLNGDFSYDGNTSKVTRVTYSSNIYLSGWSLSSHNEYGSGSTAYGDATFKGPGGASEDVSLTLTCDKNGNIT